MSLGKYEQETVINFNAREKLATIYTRDHAIMKLLDTLVIEFPDTYKCIAETDIDKTYSLPKKCISYRGKRHLNQTQREAAKERMNRINNSNFPHQ